MHDTRITIYVADWELPDFFLDDNDEVDSSSTQLGAREPVVIQLLQKRRSKGLSQAELARRIGISQRTLQDWERGRRQPKGPSRALLNRVLVDLQNDSNVPDSGRH